MFVPAEHWVDAAAEKARYDEHRNEVHDPRYRGFLSQLTAPLLERLPRGSRGLDFGCGPGPALAAMLTEAGMDVDLFDPFYAPNAGVWDRRYHFITASEVVEHLRRPHEEFERLFGILEPGAWLAIMTRRFPDFDAFAASSYIRDPTHIAFYDVETFRWMAGYWGATLVVPDGSANVVLFRTGGR